MKWNKAERAKRAILTGAIGEVESKRIWKLIENNVEVLVFCRKI